MRTSCLDHAGSHLCSYLGNRGILLHVGCSHAHILCHILLAGGLGYRLQIWLVAEVVAEIAAEVLTEVAGGTELDLDCGSGDL